MESTPAPSPVCSSGTASPSVVFTIFFFSGAKSGTVKRVQTLDLLGSVLMLLGLSGVPWYSIRVRVTQETWYVFSYSPFRLLIDMGDRVDSQLLYRADAAVVGVIFLALLVIVLLKSESRKIRGSSTFVMLILLLFFVSLLPIHIATASRLTVGTGVYLIGGACMVFTASMFQSNVVQLARRLASMLVNSHVIVKIFISSNISYMIIKRLLS